MDARAVEVECPCCRARLEVDVRTASVLRWSRASETDETGKPVVREQDWDDASAKVRQRLDSAGDKFDQSLSRERSREKDLDELFRKASEKQGRKEQE